LLKTCPVISFIATTAPFLPGSAQCVHPLPSGHTFSFQAD
jgi:hypothetical protein